MAGETDTLLNGGTESAHFTGTDTPDNFEFIERDDDNDEDEEAGTKGAEAPDDEDEPVLSDGEEGDDAEAAEDDTSADDKDATASTVKDDVIVPMPDGSRVELGELKKGYLRQADFTRKTTDLANSRKVVSEQAVRIDRIVETFTDFLASRLPPEPGLDLLATDPQAYMLQKGQYDATLNQMRELFALADQPKALKKEIDTGDRREKLERENRALIEAVPMVGNERGRKQFFEDVFRAAGEFGFTDAEMKSADDHRLLVMAHYAAKGIAAEKAKAKAKEKVENVPPVSNARPKASAPQPNKARYQDHMAALRKSGDMDDAVKAYLARQR